MRNGKEQRREAKKVEGQGIRWEKKGFGEQKSARGRKGKNKKKYEERREEEKEGAEVTSRRSCIINALYEGSVIVNTGTRTHRHR